MAVTATVTSFARAGVAIAVAARSASMVERMKISLLAYRSVIVLMQIRVENRFALFLDMH
ncbi:hypothetical protein PPNSA23_01740 [Phyllobacterium phragmitis]|uniref:Uncharacterized protein n=1 Tax=Phyllobacterium phragmitis TaxID=2670329 RepID=A0ABQ0GU77_9HYPH